MFNKNIIRINLILIIVAVLITGCSDDNITLQHNPAKANAEISIIFLGDTSFRSGYLGTKKYDSIKNEFGLMLGDAYYVIDNLEAPITGIRKSPFAGKKLYIHAENTTATPILLKDLSIDAVSLANNHIMDYEFKGLQDTIGYLKEINMGFFGAGDNSGQASEPLVINLTLNNKMINIYLIAGFQYLKSYDSNYHFYAGPNKGGVANLNDENVLVTISNIKQREPDSIVVIYPHWGVDYEWKNDAQESLAREFIKAGADLIIGTGSHTIQQIEYINGRATIYGIGNFIFNSSGRYELKNAAPYSLIVRMIIKYDENEHEKISLRLYPIVTDNLLTGYKPRFANKQEFDQVYSTALDKSKSLPTIGNEIRADRDSSGCFLEIPVRITN
jgi:hypothetical protein